MEDQIGTGEEKILREEWGSWQYMKVLEPTPFCIGGRYDG
jgi:hypothetical protein